MIYFWLFLYISWSIELVYLKYHFVFLINWNTKLKLKFSRLSSDFCFYTEIKTQNIKKSVHQKYNSFFDLKTKQILKNFYFLFFNFITKIEKWKNFFEIHFLISNQKMNTKILVFLKLALNQNRFKKIFFFIFCAFI